ncbi:hypothetical protein SLI_6822 [Streptomyces lividans 1326]|uniref:Uncharacterized protein n=1 Tax=Streptomyces lividans 1326 TaxID=1200984 RepID=A0A7U9HF93_STRLI|nr:hypothetical protein SLI_6822 [Streptomyces lividans 1326]
MRGDDGNAPRVRRGAHRVREKEKEESAGVAGPTRAHARCRPGGRAHARPAACDRPCPEAGS